MGVTHLERNNVRSRISQATDALVAFRHRLFSLNMHHLVKFVIIAILLCNALAQCPFHSKGKTEDLSSVVREITKASLPKDSSSSDPLQEMNQLLQQNYQATKQVMLQHYLNEWPLIFMMS